MAVRRPSVPAKARATRRASTGEPEIPEPIVLTPEEAWAWYDGRARELLGISAEEFERRLEAGEYNGPVEDGDVVAVWFLRTPRPGA